MRRLAAAVPGAPAFLPHVTLLGGVQSTEAAMLERARALAGQLKVGKWQGWFSALQAPQLHLQGTRTMLPHPPASCPSQPQLCPPPPLLQPYRIAFDRVSCGTIFHQCVYVLCETEPATMQVRQEGRAREGRGS